MSERKSLSDILSANSDREKLSSLWKATAAAAEFVPLPKGEFIFRIIAGELFNSKRNNTPGFKLTLEVAEGEFEGRRAWVDFWLTPAALPMSKRDLGKIGIKDLEQLETPLPPGILIRGKLTLRKDDDGNESNRLVRLECVGIEPGDAFEPKGNNTQGDGNNPPPARTPSTNGTPAQAEGNGQQAGELFPFGVNVGTDAGFLAHERGAATP